MLAWLNNQLYSTKKKVEDAERAFLAFKKRQNIFSFEGKQKINVQKIEEMNADYIKTQSQLLEVEARIEELKKFIKNSEGGRIRNIPTFLQNKLLQDFYEEFLRAEVEYRKISGVFKHKHPEMIKITSKITEFSTKIRQQLQKALENEYSHRAVLLAREKAMKNAMGGYEAEAIDTNRKELQYGILEREVATNREIYNTLLGKIKESDITTGIIKSNLRLVEPATIPIAPVKPKKSLNLILSLIFGLLTGVGLAFFLEYLDRTLHNKDDAEKFLGLPILSEVPLEMSLLPRRKRNSKPIKPNSSDPYLNIHFSEAFNSLVTNLRFTELNPSNGVYLIAGSVPQEGKSTICFNLGLTLAQMGIKTLLVDTDLRMPVLKRITGIEGKQGLTDILIDTFNTEVKNGTLDELVVNDIHKLLEVQEKSGVLHYKNDVYRFEVLFRKGKIIDVDWVNRPVEKRLGTLLVQSEKITKQQAQIALAKHQSASARLGQVLLQLGFLSVEELAGPLKLHFQENIRELHKCHCAEFHFEEDDELASTPSEPRVSALEEALGKIDTSSRKNAPFLINKIHQHLFQTGEKNLWVLPSGKSPSDPTRLLASSRIKVLMSLIRDEFDFILLDSPPLNSFSDAAVLGSTLCDGIILVIRAGKTRHAEIRRGMEQLKAVKTPVVGAVLNMIDFKKDPYYDRYYYKYDRYYPKSKKSK
jgi:Mrp family chromosome partitioning ATPase